MRFTGEIQSITKDWNTNKFIVSFSMNESLPVDEVNSLMGDKLNVEAKKWRKKRSLDANGYLWVLLTEIANVISSSKEEVYEEMLQKYGYLYQDEDGEYITITLKSSVDVAKVDGHWKFYKSNGKFNAYLMIKGTSEYDTKEMAHFLDMVIEEAKDLGIQTETPDEIAKMKALWGMKNGK
jgi:hypothetical protein